ncbi:MAG: xanthine dehydrogenase family protein subunit M [Chloroflexi bacterium]|nr:xanthine dehydrogenase family protein subunit M [Chloroflexota bacterium]
MRFDYYQPKDLQDAVTFLEREGAGAQALAGGTDLMPRIKDRLTSPKFVVNVKALEQLQGMGADGGGFRIGALTTIRTLETSPLVRRRFPALAQAAGVLGSVQIRNIATVGGNLCHGVPSAETAAPLLALDARANIAGPHGNRSVPLDQFFLGPRRTVLQPGELLKELVLPPLPERSGSAYIKLGHRQAMDLAIVGVAAFVALDSQGRCSECRIGLGAVAPTPARAKQAEKLLKGEKLTEAAISQAAEIGMGECQPIDDLRASRVYRCEMVKVLTARALNQALAMAQGEKG